MAKKRKYALGGIDPLSLASGAFSIATSLYGAAEAKKTADATSDFNKSVSDQMRNKADATMLDSFNQSGVNKEFYAEGGFFNLNRRTKGNMKKFKPVAADVFEVQGRKHGKGGGTKFGDAEFERGELVKPTPHGLEILSDQDKVLGYSPADKVKKGLAGDIISAMFDKEFSKQEAAKGTPSNDNKFDDGGLKPIIPIKGIIPTSKQNTLGTKYGTTAGNLDDGNKFAEAIPYLMDNTANLITTIGTPKVPKPILMPDTKINTDINVSPMIDEVRSNERGAVRNVNRNISDSNVATALGIQVGNDATKAINGITANEQNQENALKNQQAQLNQRTQMANVQLGNEYQDMNMQRSLGMNSAINENVNNLTRDLIDMQDKSKFVKRDNTRMALELGNDVKGVMAGNIKSGLLDDFIAANPTLDTSKWHPDNIKELAARKKMLEMQQLNK